VSKLQGNRVEVAVVKLYEYEVAGPGGGGQGSSTGAGLLPRNVLTLSPNPFSGRVTVRYQLAKPANRTLEVFDASGRIVRVLERGMTTSGMHSVQFDSRDARGARLSPGIYFVRLRTDDLADTRKVILSR
jgi:hypothetical protein